MEPVIEEQPVEKPCVVTEHDHIQEIFEKIESKRNVKDLIISKKMGMQFFLLKISEIFIHFIGDCIKSSMNLEKTLQFTGCLNQLTDKTRSFMRKILPDETVDFLRVRTHKNEIIVAFDPKYDIIVIQNLPS